MLVRGSKVGFRQLVEGIKFVQVHTATPTRSCTASTAVYFTGLVVARKYCKMSSSSIKSEQNKGNPPMHRQPCQQAGTLWRHIVYIITQARLVSSEGVVLYGKHPTHM